MRDRSLLASYTWSCSRWMSAVVTLCAAARRASAMHTAPTATTPARRLDVHVVLVNLNRFIASLRNLPLGSPLQGGPAALPTVADAKPTPRRATAQLMRPDRCKPGGMIESFQWHC